MFAAPLRLAGVAATPIRGMLRSVRRLALSLGALLALGCAQRANLGSLPDAGPGGSVDAAGDGDAGPGAPDDAGPSCTAGCVRYGGCFGPDAYDACLMACRDPGQAAAVIECVAMTDGCDFSRMCGGDGTDPRMECADNCELQGNVGCITSVDVATCVEACGTASDATIDQFNRCTSSCRDDGCFRVLVPGGSANRQGCRDACDDMRSLDCIFPAEHLDCLDRCARASATAIDDFIRCNRALCDGPACYDQLFSAVP